MNAATRDPSHCSLCGTQLPLRAAREGETPAEWECIHCGQFQAGIYDEQPRNTRHRCNATVLVARAISGQLPREDLFQQVHCCDLSTGGLSYVSRFPASPSTAIMVAIGEKPNRRYLSAEVRFCRQAKEGSNRLFQIGCQFTGKLESCRPWPSSQNSPISKNISR